MYICLNYCILSIYFILFSHSYSTFIYIYNVPTIVSCYLVGIVIIDSPQHRRVIGMYLFLDTYFKCYILF